MDLEVRQWVTYLFVAYEELMWAAQFAPTYVLRPQFGNLISKVSFAFGESYYSRIKLGLACKNENKANEI